MFIRAGVAGRFRNLERATRGPSRGRRKFPKYEPRDGPKLVRGRGWKRRRRNDAHWIRFVFCVAFALIFFGLATTVARVLMH